MSVCLSVHMEQLGSHRTDIRGIWCLLIFSKLSWENSSVVYMWQEYRALYMNTKEHLWSHLAQCFLQWEMPQTNAVENIKTYILCIIAFLNHARCEIMWKNMVESDRPQMTIWRMRIACWIHKATNTHSKYGILTYFPLQQWLL